MVEFIKYKNKEYPVKVGYYALKHASKEAEKETGKELDMSSLMSGDMTILEPLLFYSLKMGAKLEETEMDIPREDMEFVLDGCFMEFIEMINRFQATPETIKKSNEADDQPQILKKSKTKPHPNNVVINKKKKK